MIVVLVGCLTVVATFVHAAEWELPFFFNSDMLYLPSIYRDIFIDGGSLGDWWLNPAPNFFPDMGLFFLLNWLFGSVAVTSYAFAVVQFAIIAVLFRAICKASGMVKDEWSIALSVLLLTLIFITGLWGGDFGFAFQLLVNSFHTGAFMNALLCTWLLMLVLSGRSNWWLLPLALAIVAGAASDKLFWIMFSVPATISCLLLAVRKPARWRWIGVAVLVAGSTWIADISLRAIDEALPLTIEKPYQYMAFERIGFSWDRFLFMLSSYLAGQPLTASLIALGLVATLWAMLRGAMTARTWFRTMAHSGAAEDVRPFVLRWMIAMFFPFVLLAPVLNGSFDGLDSIRYDFAVFMLAPLVAGLQVAQWAGRRAQLLVLVVGSVIGLPTLWVCATAGEDYQHIALFKPERVRAIDSLARELGLKNGVANYWDAKLMTMFTEEDLIVMPVFGDAGVYYHVNREEMFYSSARKHQDPLMFDFVVLHSELSGDYMTRIMGRPTTRHSRDGVEVLTMEPWPFDRSTRRPAGAGR